MNVKEGRIERGESGKPRSSCVKEIPVDRMPYKLRICQQIHDFQHLRGNMYKNENRERKARKSAFYIFTH